MPSVEIDAFTQPMPSVGGPDAPTKCNRDGTDKIDSSNCDCKRKCDGPLCDKCKYGSFDGPKAEHKDGCLECWCGQLTRNCQSSNYNFEKVR
jgi:hypothetical protein